MNRLMLMLRLGAFLVIALGLAARERLPAQAPQAPQASQAPQAPQAPQAKAPPAVTLPDAWVKGLPWRGIGPANMGGRITAISVFEADPSTFWVATASGGLVKTVNNGLTFEHQFDRETTVSIGDVCVAPSDRNIVWVGTGENNPRNSVSYGDGVYKSTDGGKSWKHMGLAKSFQVGRIAVHPRNPDIVYVGALGRLYGPNPERGLFKTTDGGKTWQKIFYLDDRTGVIDVAMNPADPDTLLVAMWERRRDGFDSHPGPGLPEAYDQYDPVEKWGGSAGIYKTTDGGKTFRRLTKGLPTSKIGRVGLDYYRKDPRVVFAIVDCEKIGMGKEPDKIAKGDGFLGAQGEDADPPGARLVQIVAGGPADQAGLMPGDVITRFGKKEIRSYEDFIEQMREHSAGDKVTLKIRRDGQATDVAVTLGPRPGVQAKGGGPGGPKKGRPWHAYYGGQKENVQDKQGPDGFEYGGVYKSTDGGESWARVNSLNPRPMYFSCVRVDPQDERHVYVLGVAQFRSSDGGKTFKGDAGKGVHADGHALWIDPRDGRHLCLGTDGGVYVSYDRANNWDHLNQAAMGQFYHVAISLKQPYWVFGGLQDNGTWGGPSVGLSGGVGPVNEDWLSVFGGDGYQCAVDPSDPDLVYYEMQNGGMGRRHLRTGEVAPIRPKGLTKGGGKKGGGATAKAAPTHRFNWNTPLILSRHNPKVFYCGGEVVFRSLDRGNDLKVISPELTLTRNGTITALAESPKNADVLWAGTDDGKLWVSRDGGGSWDDLTGTIGLPGPRWVATVEASRFVEGRAYVAFDAHRSDDDRPYLYVTENFGQTWHPITANLPAFGSTRCLREDADNPDLLYCGTEFGVFASLDRGKSWAKINNNLPTVAVHEIAVHPTAGEIVAATHGRSLWILDVSALRQMKADAVRAKAHLYRPPVTVRWQVGPAHGKTNRRFVGQNPPPGAPIYFSLAEPAKKVTFEVRDVADRVLAKWTAAGKAGLNRTSWDLTRLADGPPRGEAPKKGGKKGFVGGPPRRFAAPGEYRVVMAVEGHEAPLTTTLRLEGDPNLPPGRQAAEDEVPPLKGID